MLIKIVHTQPRCAELAICGELDMAATDELLSERRPRLSRTTRVTLSY